MTWSDEVYENRFSTAVARASAERRLRKKGLPVPVMSTADSGPVAAMVVVMSGLLAWQQYGAHVRSALAQNPLVQQIRSLVFGKRASGPRQVSTAPKGGGSSSASKGGSKVTARRPAAGTTGSGALAPMATAAAPATPAAAAAAAAIARSAPAAPMREAQSEAQPEASTSAPSASTSSSSKPSGGSKKKKGGSKRRR